MKKLLLLAGAVLLLAVSGLGGYMLIHHARHRAHCERFHGERFQEIKPGMTRAEVEELLGAPPGNYARKGYMVFAYGHIIAGGEKREEWIDDKHLYEVFYTRDDVVVGTHTRANLIDSK